jgi:hypothetical protein
MQTGLRVDNQHEEIGFLNRLQHLSLDLDIHRNAGVVGQSAGIDQPELTSIPVGAREMAIPGRASLVADYRAVIADDAVEKRGLPDVGTSDECDDRKVHAGTPLSSDSRISMKSYEGKIGIGSDALTLSRV